MMISSKKFKTSHRNSFYIRNFFILFGFLALSFLIFISCGSKGNFFDTGYSDVCTDYVIDVRIEYSDQTPGQSLNANVQGDRLGPVQGGEIVVTGNTIRLELSFSLRQHSNAPSLLQVVGVGTARNFQGEFGVNIGPLSGPLSLGVEEHPSDTIADVVKDAVRDGYERLRDTLGERGALGQQRLTSTISEVGGNTIRVPLGLSDHVQEGDVFYIYPGGGYNSNCNNIRRSGPPLSTASVIDINQDSSILEMDIVQQNRRRNVQRGDIVEISPEIDFESRNQSNEPRISTLRLGYIHNILITFRTRRSRFNDRYGGYGGYGGYNNRYPYGDRFTTRPITSLIRTYLTTEAREFDFRVIR